MRKGFIIIAIMGGILILGSICFLGYKKLFNKLENESIFEDKTLSQYIGKEVGTYQVKDIKCSALQEHKILYLENNYMILDNYELYDTLFGRGTFYSNDEQCRKVELVQPIKEIKYFETMPLFKFNNDNKYYSYVGQDVKEEPKFRNNVSMNSILNNPNIKSIVYMKDSEKIVIYGVVKTDGNIYEQKYNRDDTWREIDASPIEEKIIVSSADYGKIIDARYSSELYTRSSQIMTPESINYIMTENGPYFGKYIQTDECKKYEDIECKVELRKSEIYQKYEDEIFFSNSEWIITKDMKMFNTMNLFED